MGILSCQVSQNLYCKQNHEFDTFLCQVRIVINNQSGKIIGFTDFSNWYNSRMRGCLVGFLLFFSHLEFKKNCGFFLLVSGEK